jgi:hypothetical protein
VTMAPGPPPAARADRLLNVRRAGWRFLLALPRPGRVVCLGDHDPALVAALREVGGDVSVGVPSGGTAYCDVLVLVSPTREELARAPTLLRPGGWVYVETGGLLRRRRRTGAVRGVSACVCALRALEFENVSAHWHFPDFESCLEIVPLNDRHALALSLRRRQRRLGTRFQVLGARLAVSLRLLPHVVPSVSVIGSLPQSPLVRDRP